MRVIFLPLWPASPCTGKNPSPWHVAARCCPVMMPSCPCDFSPTLPGGAETPPRLRDEDLLISSPVNDITVMLRSVQDRDLEGADKLLPLVYEDLRRVASHRMAQQPAGHTLQATALVHEAFLRLVGNPGQTWTNRRHFFAAASEAMRHILVDRARRKAAVRHGGRQVRLPL